MNSLFFGKNVPRSAQVIRHFVVFVYLVICHAVRTKSSVFDKNFWQLDVMSAIRFLDFRVICLDCNRLFSFSQVRDHFCGFEHIFVPIYSENNRIFYYDVVLYCFHDLNYRLDESTHYILSFPEVSYVSSGDHYEFAFTDILPFCGNSDASRIYLSDASSVILSLLLQSFSNSGNYYVSISSSYK